MAIKPRPNIPPLSNLMARTIVSTPKSNARSLAEKLIAKHHGQGIPEVSQPFKDVSEIPEIPEDITELEDKRLSALYGRLDAFASFVGYRLAQAEVNKLDTGRRLKDLEARLILENLEGVKKGEITKKKTETYLDKRLVELREQETYHNAEVKLLKARHEGIERTIRVLSREQTRREANQGHHGRRPYRQP